MKNIGEVFEIRKKESHQNAIAIILIILLSIIICGLLLNLYLLLKDKSALNGVIPKNVSVDLNFDCSNLSLQETSYCLNNFVKSIFHYRESNDSITLSLKQLAIYGGDCEDWNINFYQKEFKKLGFKTEINKLFIKNKLNKRYYHVFLIAYDSTGYCNLDQLIVDCYVY